MAILYLVRHGDADYSEMLEKGFYGFGRSFAPLSEVSKWTYMNGSQIKQTSILLRRKHLFMLTHEFNLYKGVYPEGQQMRWETLEEVRERMRRVAYKYADYKKVIFVGHGMAFRTLTYIERMRPAEIVECIYNIGQDDCEYSFS